MSSRIPIIHRRALLSGAAVLVAVGLPRIAIAEQADPLPSWNDTAPKQAIRTFVESVTRDGGHDFVPPAQRIAVFDNDGTLWGEQPMYFQLAFAIDRIKALAASHPEWKETQPYKAALEDDTKALAASGNKGIMEILAATHAGVTTEAFADTVAEWLQTARHPRFQQPYDKLVYRPQLELLAYLRANGFKTFIVSGGGVEFMRVFAERAYGIPPEQVVGSSIFTTLQIDAEGKPQLIKQPKIEFVDDGPGKPVGINRFIGRRPILAFGNSDGDQQMLEWTSAGDAPRLAALLHHTDAEREWAYDRASHVGKLDKALEEARLRGWTVVDMKRDWKRVFAFEPKGAL
ncbi:HAD family hydrolase [Methylobacterium brachythecii]|uniref:phosphoserine phosphatase n=1 Tax=Methylobacterium brachythecii TaxID=1176177 RepID=A0A7W6AI84_9HYPH|nr:HAD family hydrolase [Methylobacterium brachythecii]MBB3902846.1 phosphoglycolate phosphatase-like HAD superfamily hydrolase [Methylobacterium brachythecii]GLS43772.1 haloacid dehalogenase [Methylobacterium brachythecii]